MNFLVRIINVDFYMSTPAQGLDVMYSEFRGSSINQVPVIRVFGATSTGEKICVHIHGVFPYFFIPYDGGQDEHSLKYKIASSIDKAINIYFNQASSNAQHVYKISLVSGIPMYGYHAKKHQFFKIFLYNPILINKVTNLLLNESTLGKFYQPHETHLNFTLQFMIDYNLHGMSNMIISEVRFRKDHSNLFESNLGYDLKKQTVCVLEADALSEHIVNRLEIATGCVGTNPGIATLWAEERQRRRNKGESSQLQQFLELSNINVPPTKSHEIYRQALLDRLAILSTDKDDADRINSSVYPAETPDDIDIENASMIDSQTPSSHDESSLLENTTLTEDKTLTRIDFDITLDPEAKDLLEILEQLENENKKDLEDNILTQLDKEEDLDLEDELDLSVPLMSAMTPTKFVTNELIDDDELFQEMNSTFIPQLDGQIFDEDLEEKNSKKIINLDKNKRKSFIKKACYIKVKNKMNSQSTEKSMPVLIDLQNKPEENSFPSFSQQHTNIFQPSKNDFPDILEEIKQNRKYNDKFWISNCKSSFTNKKNTIKQSTKSFQKEQITQKRMLKNNKKNNKQSNFIRIIQETHRKDLKMMILLSKSCKPRFKIIQGCGKQLNPPKLNTKISVLGDFVLKTGNNAQVDPDLHLIIKYPDENSFLYYYDKKIYPNVVKIPRTMKNKMDLESLIVNNKYVKDLIDLDNKNNVYLFSAVYLTNTLENNGLKKLKLSELKELSKYINIELKKHNDYIKNSMGNKKVFSFNLPEKSQGLLSLKEKSDNKNFQFKNKNEFKLPKKQNNLNKNKDEISNNKDELNTTKNINKKEKKVKIKKVNISKVIKNIKNLKKINKKIIKRGSKLNKKPDKVIKKEEEIKENDLRITKNNNEVIEEDNFNENNVKAITREDKLNKNKDVVNKNEKELKEKSNKEIYKNDNKVIQKVYGVNENKGNETDKELKEDSSEINIKINNQVIQTKDKVIKKKQEEIKKGYGKSCIKNKNKVYNKKENLGETKEKVYKKENNLNKNFDQPNKNANLYQKEKKVFKKGDKFKKNTDQIFINKKSKVNKKVNNINKNEHKLNKTEKKDKFKDLNVVTSSSLEFGSMYDFGTEMRRSARLNLLKYPILTNLPALDGIFDSSSSDEEISTQIKKKKSPLINSITSFKRRKIDCHDEHSASHGPISICPNLASNIENAKMEKSSLTPFYPKKQSCDINVKRKLSFQTININTTIIEEEKICNFSPRIQRKSKLVNSRDNIVYSDTLNRDKIEKHITDCTNIDQSNLDLFSNLETNEIILLSSSDDLNRQKSTIQHSALLKEENFQCQQILNSNSKDEHEKSFFLSMNFEEELKTKKTSVAEKYDEEKNYKAKQSSSTIFTPELQETLSLNSFNLNSVLESSNLHLTAVEKEKKVDKIEEQDELMELDDEVSMEIGSEKFQNYSNFIPLHKAPSKHEVQSSLLKLNLPYIRQEVPFYSNFEDVTGNVEIGCNVLKINSKTTADLEDFKNTKDSLNLFRKKVLESMTITNLKSLNLKKMCFSFCKNSDTVLMPAKKPPTFQMVKNWLNEKQKKNNKKIEKTEGNQVKMERSKIYIPISPGNGKEDEMNLSLTLSPCTPLRSQSSVSSGNFKENLANLTPKSSRSSQSSSNLFSSYELGKNQMNTNQKLNNNQEIEAKEKDFRGIFNLELIKSKSFENILKNDYNETILVENQEEINMKSSNHVINHGESCTVKKHGKSNPPKSFLKSLLTQDGSSSNKSCQLSGNTVNNTYGFNFSIDNLQQARAVIEHQNLTLLVMELHIKTRGDLRPNPTYDPIRAVFYAVYDDVSETYRKNSKQKGVIVVNFLSPETFFLNGTGEDFDTNIVDTEENLINEFLNVIKYWDPDIFAGYEIEMLSWSYLIERASILGLNLKPKLGRIIEENLKGKSQQNNDSELKITGRITLDVWRLMRYEISLQSYSFESIVYNILHRRIPFYCFKDLSFFWDHKSNLYRHRTLNYYLLRVVMIIELFDKLDLLNRTSELARLFGIQFFEVLSRGSQFRVESMMLRLAKPSNFVPVSPSVAQRAHMKAPEYIALVMEPESKLYNDPVIVLDFQSLYPSIIIAYNYCFTTCVGHVGLLGKNEPFEFGATQLKIPRKLAQRLAMKDRLNFSPCGVGFVKKSVRDGILPRMLREILDCRLMVKNSMKENKSDRILQRALHSRQLGLKLIANVTYGYTAANFSGRMPSVEVGDSVVSKGRETLQRAIELVDNSSQWGTKVVYGDTDSLFVLVPGRTREEAFEIGRKIANAVTEANPDPIKLKLEKVYQPCILQTKKRYVGYMYESPEQEVPVYEAKGIETVRRDGCPAVSKMLEKCLRLLFETKDVSIIKQYVLRQFHKILSGRASIQDLTFAKEYRGASGYRPGACVPSLELARKWKAIDPRREPRRGERVPYVIINGPPGLPLIRLVRCPRDLLTDPSLRPNALYYISKAVIPPINRCFSLMGADLNVWFNQMPRKQYRYLPTSVSPNKKSTISQYFSTMSCVACGEQTLTGLCCKCFEEPQKTVLVLTEKLKSWEDNYGNCNLICQSCTLTQTDVKCVSLDCPVFYRRIQTLRDLDQSTFVRQLLSLPQFELF